MVLDLGRQPWGNHFVPMDQPIEVPTYPLRLFFCNGCSMVQIDYTVPKEVMFIDHSYLSGTTRSLRHHFSNACDAILKRIDLAADDYVLDIGGNDGTFLAFFRDNNINVLNVESSIKQARISQENTIPCINKFFNESVANEILAEKGPARIIHGSGVFFHLEELHSAFSGVKTLLHPDGLVVAEFLYLPDMVRSCAFDQIYHEHLLYYTIQSFQRLLSYHGLTIFDAELAPIHGGTCIAYITRAGKATKTQAVHKLIRKEIAGGFDRIDVYHNFARRALATRDTLVTMVRQLRAQAKTIQALGAPVKGATILNCCGLTHEDIECAVEINRLKCNTYYPGTKIPVYHQDDVKPPDVYLLLAWNFKHEILPKLSDFRKRGGKVLVPIPEPTLI